jgi:hypothetical protein
VPKHQVANRPGISTPFELCRLIARLPPHQPLTVKFERELATRGLAKPSNHANQREHWLSWLREYNGPGYYSRCHWDRPAEFVYNHIQCAAMLHWLGEAIGVPKGTLTRAAKETLRAGRNGAAQCAAVRTHIPWQLILGRARSSKG